MQGCMKITLPPTARHDVPSGIGRMMHVLNTRNVTAGWRRLSDSPGSPKGGLALTPVAGRLFLLGGTADSWCYDPSRDGWSRLPDMPLPNPFKVGGSPAFMDRFILAVGGAAYFKAVGANGSFPYPARPDFMPRCKMGSDACNETCKCTADSNPDDPGALSQVTTAAVLRAFFR